MVVGGDDDGGVVGGVMVVWMVLRWNDWFWGEVGAFDFRWTDNRTDIALVFIESHLQMKSLEISI